MYPSYTPIFYTRNQIPEQARLQALSLTLKLTFHAEKTYNATVTYLLQRGAARWVWAGPCHSSQRGVL